MNTLVLLALILFALMILIGGKIGARSFISLFLNFGVVLLTVFIMLDPQVNPIILTIIACTGISCINLFYINKVNSKTIAAFVATVITITMLILFIYLSFYEVYQTETFVKSVIDYYVHHQDAVNEEISRFLTGYTIERISKVERNILRLAVSELLSHGAPVKVVIDEAVKLAKNYGDKDSHRFVNGVLKNFAVQNEG